MTFILPTPNNNHETGRGVSDPLWLADINAPSNTGTKAAGNLPITRVAKEYDNNTVGTLKGYGMEFINGQTGYDVSTNTKVMLWHSQFNAPNRINVDTVANGGVTVRIYSGTGTMPTNYKEYLLGGNDTPWAECIKGHYPFTIDLNDTTNDSTNGTFDNTNVTSYAYMTFRFAMSGSSSNWNYQGKLYILDTIKTSASTPTFSGLTSSIQDAVTLIQGTDFTNKLGNWVRQIGSVVFIDMPFRIGDASTATTFNDDGLTVISPVSNDTADPRVRITTQAMRTYINLRNNVADTATFSGTYKWGTRAAFDWSQADAAVVTFNNPTFNGMGTFTLGSSTTGSATWENVDSVVLNDTGVNIDGSTFKNQNGNYALEMTGGVMDISDMRFESYASKHAILINTAGTYNFTNIFFDQSGTNDIETTHTSGVVTINVLGTTVTPTVTVTGAGTVDIISLPVTIKITATTSAGVPIQSARVLLRASDNTGDFPYQETVTMTSSFTTVTVTHTAHGLNTSDYVSFRGADQSGYDGVFQVLVNNVNTYTFTATTLPSASPATGTIQATFAAIYGLTDVNGEITTSRVYNNVQPVSGWARKSTSSPYYKEGILTGTVNTSTGFNATTVMILDE